MSDCREKLLRDIEVILAESLDPGTCGLISEAVMKCFADYEITERCTDLIPVDSPNEKILKRYCACLRLDGKSENTIYQYLRTCTRLGDCIRKPFTEMGTYDVRYFLACEKDRGISGRTVENTRSHLSAFFQWLTNEEIITKNPLAKIKPIKYSDVAKHPFSDTDIDALRGACRNDRERAIIELLLSSGIRVSELTDLNKEDIDFRELSVHVRHGKGDKERLTYTTTVAAKYIESYLAGRKDGAPFLIVNRSNEPLSTSGVRHILKRISKRAGVHNVHPHRFRRTFATGLAARGMDVQDIQVLLGHESIETTIYYVCTSDRKVLTSYRRFTA